jgi:hypothetical protein
LALINEAELVVDDVTGFVRDHQYKRKYALDCFHITARKATAAERLEPFERYRRGVTKWLSRNKPFARRKYLEQEGPDFDERLLNFKINGTLYLDGYWQSECYFKDVEQIIREDLRIIPPEDLLNKRIADEICNNYSVALHVRWFDAPGSTVTQNVSSDYYRRAIAFMDEKIKFPRYFLFSDDPEASRAKLALPAARVTYISHNQGDANAHADLWLMSQCQHIISANSTFSWWGAWLNPRPEKIVVAPREGWSTSKDGIKGLLPKNWVTL